VLQPLSLAVNDPNLLVGLQTSDDAAVYRLSDDLALVQTVDFFPPVVDDAYTYGAIAAANSMSDVFAMGGEVMLALNIAAFPDDLPLDILSRIFQGGADKAKEAGIVIAGGHTVTDDEPKYGLVVTGTIHPAHILTKAGAQPGDRLFVTKRFGTGVITTALKQQAADPQDAEAAIESMLLLNRAASRIVREVGAHACTDITGFGLLGHATEVAIKSGVALEIVADAIPWLPGARRYATEGRVPGGSGRNRDFYEPLTEAGVTLPADIPDDIATLLFSPETSGGLLLAVPEELASAMRDAFAEAGHGLWEIGAVREGRGIRVS
jgi:selenide,water dikinase